MGYEVCVEVVAPREHEMSKVYLALAMQEAYDCCNWADLLCVYSDGAGGTSERTPNML